VQLALGDTDGVRALCLDPHDLAIAKYAAFREKDLVFTRELARRGIVSEELLLTLLEQSRISDDMRERILARTAADFATARSG
jgi:hypothetical protein